MADVRRAVAAFVLTCAAVVFVPGEAAAAVECSILDFQSTRYSGLSRLVRIDVPSGTTTDLGQLRYQIQAAGYSKEQDVVYGIAGGSLLDSPRLVTVDRRGTAKDLGPVRHGVGGVAAPTAGSVAGSRLYLRDLHRLYTVDIDPRSPSYKSVVRVVRLSPVYLALEVDDFAADPATGLLYGISTFGHTARVVSLNPVNGAVRVVAAVPGAPWQDSYSSVVIGSRELYAVHTGYGRRSRLFRIGFDGSARELSSWKPLASSDAAGCLNQAAQPPPPPPTPIPTPTPTSTVRPPTVSPTPTPRPTPRPTSRPPRMSAPLPTQTVAVPPPPRPRSPRPTPAPTPTPPPRDNPATPRSPRTVPPSAPAEFDIAPQVAAVPAAEDRDVQVLRRWSLATLLMILFGGAAAAAQRRMRRR